MWPSLKGLRHPSICYTDYYFEVFFLCVTLYRYSVRFECWVYSFIRVVGCHNTDRSVVVVVVVIIIIIIIIGLG
jgi:hypothetical protein